MYVSINSLILFPLSQFLMNLKDEAELKFSHPSPMKCES